MNLLDRLNLPKSMCPKEYGEFCTQWSPYPFPEDKWHGVVLCLLIENSLFLIKRSEDMPTHAGQIGMIGGHRAPDENHSIAVAEREFEEETGFSRDSLELLGLLPPVFTAKNRIIIPHCYNVHMSLEEFRSEIESNGEWSQGFLVSLNDLAQEENWSHFIRHGDIFTNSILFFDLMQSANPIFISGDKGFSHVHENEQVRQAILWGATGRIVWDLLRQAHR